MVKTSTPRSSLIRISDDNKRFLEGIRNEKKFHSIDQAITKIRIDSMKKKPANILDSKDFGL